ncbi:lysophospholipid acyltransferase family protein [Desulfobacterales bacterium HSG16]|nr:lysophospholipid acyltransferase family protein [Desulfobacterales bacterium HSG16]
MDTFNNTLFKIIDLSFSLIGRIPRPLAVFSGTAIGQIWYAVDKTRREITHDNLAQAYGKSKDSADIKRLARRVFHNLGRTIFELGWSTHLSHKDFSRHFEIRGLSNYHNAIKKNKGILFLTAHTGNWELLSIINEMTGYPVNVIYRPLDFKPMEMFITQLRTRFGAKLIPASRSMPTIMKCLGNKGHICILMDQSADWYNGVFVNFFGRNTCTTKGMALIALRSKTPVLPLFMAREGKKFIAEFGPEIPLIDTNDQTRDVEENTRHYSEVIEAFIRRYPEQWFWVHRRWKTLPAHPWPRQK